MAEQSRWIQVAQVEAQWIETAYVPKIVKVPLFRFRRKFFCVLGKRRHGTPQASLIITAVAPALDYIFKNYVTERALLMGVIGPGVVRLSST